MLISIVVLSSISSLATGFVDSLAVLALMRVVHASLNSFTNPLMYSLIAQYFPKTERATANSLVQSSNFIGISISSLSIILISQYGWRITYYLMGAFGIFLGLIGFLFIRDP
jgi:ACS family D-galactonate transporter-like MFS transporter